MAEEKKLMCPILMPNSLNPRFCIKEKCAWWDGNGCCIRNLGHLSTLILKGR